MRTEKSHPSDTQNKAGGKATAVLAIACVTGSSKADEWNFDMLQTGDVVEEITIGGSPAVKAPFKGGRCGVQKLLHSAFNRGDTSISVRVRRGKDESLELHACIVPHEPAGRKQYVLRSIHDPNYAVTFVDCTDSECAELQGSRSSRVASALSKAQLQDGFVCYRWEKKMKESLPIQNSSSFLSLLILPKAADPSGTRYNCLEDTLTRANAWLNSAQASGVPIVFMNVQSEALLTKVRRDISVSASLISGETANATVTSGSLNDLCNLANASLYGFEDYHGVDIGVVRGVRLWYTPVAGEYPVEIKLLEHDSRLGFAVSRTEEGFIYVSSAVDDDDNGLPSTRSGLRDLYKEATRASKLLVISRVSNEKILPWMVSPSGAVRCYDTVSLSQKLSLHRHALQPILLHVLLWDQMFIAPSGRSRRAVIPPLASAPPSPPHPPATERGREQTSPPVELVKNLSLTRTLARDTAGEVSLRFHDCSLPSSWV
ncbi:hypothetical protein Taro_004345 [Colocasia esculenta]|uniref:Uncharacterized protein n=1 Tax=Colocasia esculenta TaxID=4460 RepID=A0A843TRE4_COLES|nr:hypothetical protein [Colocasia esculenta]